MRSVSKRRGSGTDGVDRASLYDEVTGRIIADLESGSVPWVQPWGAAGGSGPGIPLNALTTRPYSGINILILWAEVTAKGYPSQGWLTFRQAQEAGGCVRKGERGTMVVYADRFVPEAEKARADERGEDEVPVSCYSRSLSRLLNAVSPVLISPLRGREPFREASDGQMWPLIRTENVRSILAGSPWGT